MTTEILVEADTPQEAAALASRIPPQTWRVYGDHYREVTDVTTLEVADVLAGWEDDANTRVTVQDWSGAVVQTSTTGLTLSMAEIDPGEYWGEPDA